MLGEHGRGKEGGLSEYARQIGKSQPYISRVRQAAEVFKIVKPITWVMGLLDKAKHLAAVHLAPEDTWTLLVEHLLADSWTVDETEKAVKRVKDLLAAIPLRSIQHSPCMQWDVSGVDVTMCITTCNVAPHVARIQRKRS